MTIFEGLGFKIVHAGTADWVDLSISHSSHHYKAKINEPVLTSMITDGMGTSKVFFCHLFIELGNNIETEYIC